MFFRLIKKSLLRERRRKVLALITVSLAALLLSVLGNLTVDIGSKMAAELESYGANIRIVPQGSGMPLQIEGMDYSPLENETFIEESDLYRVKDIFWGNNIVAFAPFLETAVRLEGESGEPISLIGTYFHRTLSIPRQEPVSVGVRTLKPVWQVEGEWPEDSGSDALMGRTLASALRLQVGDAIRLFREGHAPVSFRIAGILSADAPLDRAVVAPMAAVQAMSGLSGKVNAIDVNAVAMPENTLSRRARESADALNEAEYDRWYCTAYVSSIAQQLEEVFPNAVAKPIWRVAETKGAIVSRVQVLFLVVTIAILFAAGLGISTIMLTTVLERAREIALMKAIGASGRVIALFFTAEAGMLGFVGGAIGYFLGLGIVQIVGFRLFGSGIAPQPIVAPLVLVFAVGVSLLGSFFPFRRIERMRPARILHGRK